MADMGADIEPTTGPSAETADEPSTVTRVPEPRPPADAGPSESDAADTLDGLSRRDRAVLAFEKVVWRSRAAKDRAIRERFDLSSVRYYQILNSLLDNPHALAAEAELINRLRRERDERRTARSPRHADTGTDA
jgi:hypothetical protein